VRIVRLGCPRDAALDALMCKCSPDTLSRAGKVSKAAFTSCPKELQVSERSQRKVGCQLASVSASWDALPPQTSTTGCLETGVPEDPGMGKK